METRKNNNSLTEEEKKELQLLDNPAEQRMGGVAGSIFPIALFGLGNPLANKSLRKKKVVEFRIKMRAYDSDLDIDKDWQEYYRIREEEEKRFDERFKNVL